MASVAAAELVVDDDQHDRAAASPGGFVCWDENIVRPVR
jgi:hypothetical protein